MRITEVNLINILMIIKDIKLFCRPQERQKYSNGLFKLSKDPLINIF